MFDWLHRLADEGHKSQKTAIKWHTGHAVVYGVLIVGYSCMIAWHLFAGERHRRALEELEKKEREEKKK